MENIDKSQEKEYIFYTGNPDGPDIVYTLIESELEISHKELLYARFVRQWNHLPELVKVRFLQELPNKTLGL